MRRWGWIIAVILLLVGTAVAQMVSRPRKVQSKLVVYIVDPVTGNKTRVL